MADLIVRVQTPDYDRWLAAFSGATNGLLESGVTSWTVYRDSWNHNNVMVHFVAEDIDRAIGFFRSEGFKEINAASGATDRTFFIAQQPGAAAPAAKKTAAKSSTAKTAGKSTTTAKTAAKPAAPAEKAPAKPRAPRTPKK